MSKRIYNYRFSTQEERSKHPKYVEAVKPDLTKLPDKIDLSSFFPTVFDQGELGSCTANALGGCVEFLVKNFIPSRLFIYYNERMEQGTINEDSGSTITTGIDTLKKFGVCAETEWNYNIQNFKEKPSDQCYNDAKKDLVQVALNIQTLDEIKHCLYNGYPVAFAFQVFEYFQSGDMALSGILKMPQPNEKHLGGHAVLAVGYDDSKKMIKVRNSWGSDWGDNGYFYMPYDYISDTKLADDFWTIRTIL